MKNPRVGASGKTNPIRFIWLNSSLFVLILRQAQDMFEKTNPIGGLRPEALNSEPETLNGMEGVKEKGVYAA